MKETGLCENRRTVAREAIELVLKAIEENLASPEMIAEYMREYHRMSRELHSSMAHRRRDLEKRLGNVNGAISRTVDALLGEAPSRALRERLAALEAERDEIEAAIADVVPTRRGIPPQCGERLPRQDPEPEAGLGRVRRGQPLGGERSYSGDC